MAAIFSNVAPLIIAAEGGDEKIKNDYGEETKFGISQRQYPHINISELTEAGALAILERDYWDKYSLSTIDNQTVANQCFFLLVNMSPENAVKIIQTAVNGVGRTNLPLTVDGILGLQTLRAINCPSQYWLSDRIRVESCRYYLKRVDEDRSQEEFLRGWIRRGLK